MQHNSTDALEKRIAQLESNQKTLEQENEKLRNNFASHAVIFAQLDRLIPDLVSMHQTQIKKITELEQKLQPDALLKDKFFTAATLQDEDKAIEWIKSCLKEKVDIKATNSLGQTILHIAIENNKQKVIDFLLSTTLFTTFTMDDVFTLKDDEQWTPIQLIAEAGNCTLLNKLYDQNQTNQSSGRFNDLNEFKEIYAVATPEAQQLLANRKLLDSAKTGELKDAEYALSINADPNAINVYGETALHVAIYYKNDKVVELLLAKGADPTIRKTNEQTTALDYAIATKITALIEKVATCYLIQVAAKPQPTPENYELALATDEIINDKTKREPNKIYVIPEAQGITYVVSNQSNKIDCIDGKDLKNKDGSTYSSGSSLDNLQKFKKQIFKILTYRGHIPNDIIKALKNGADLVGVDALKQTALHKAVIAGNMPNINLLLKEHAISQGNKRNIYSTDNQNQTADGLARALNKTIVNKDGITIPLHTEIPENFGKYKQKAKELARLHTENSAAKSLSMSGSAQCFTASIGGNVSSQKVASTNDSQQVTYSFDTGGSLKL